MNCPLCHQNNTSFFAESEGCSYYTCGDCQLIFMYRPKTHEKLTKYYQKCFTYSLSRQNDLRLTNRADKVIKNIRSLHPNSQSLLDIGAGQGHIMRKAQRSGYHVYGIEPSLRLYRKLKNEFSAGIVNEDWDTYKKNLRKNFDVIILSHVIEHVIAPQKLVEELTRFLKPGGILYIETPNFDSYLAYYERQNYTFLSPPQHLWILSANSLAKIVLFSLKKTMFTLIKTETFSYPEHFVGVVKSIFKKPGSLYHSVKPPANFTHNVRSTSGISRMTIILFDTIIARLLYRFMNIGNKGSIIAIYLQKSL